MPTKKPRVTITLEPRVYKALKAFSDGTGQPMAQFVNEVLNQSLPVLEKLALITQRAKQAKPNALHQIVTGLGRLESQALHSLGAVTGALDMFATTSPAPESADAAPPASRIRGRSGQKTTASPPIPNRGGQDLPPTPKKTQKTPSPRGSNVVRIRESRHAR